MLNRKGNLSLEIQVNRFAGPPLVRDYLDGVPAALAFYPGAPADPDTYRRKAAEVDRRFDPESRRRMAAAIRATSPRAAARIEEVVSGNGVFVTTGQQAGLFTGPLYTVHKILSAVRLARALEPVLGRPVVPLFWIASDDHDWEEVNHAHVVDRHHVLHRVALPSPEDAPPVSMRHRLLGPDVESALDQFVEHLPTTEFAAHLIDLLREAYRPGRSVAAAFGEVIAELFAPFDLAIVDGGDPAVKALAARVMASELEQSEARERELSARAARLEEAGYHVQVPVLPGGTNLFYEDEHGRERIFRDDGGFVLRRSGRRFTGPALRALLAEAGERFSANVLLRPVVENAVFPTVAYVGGPGEVSYYAQLAPLFDAHGIAMPVVFPRFAVTLVEAKIRKVLDKFHLGVDDFRRPAHELAAQVLREETPAEVKQAVGALRQVIAEGYERLTRAAQPIDPTLKGPLQGARNASFVELAEAEKKIAQHLKMQANLGLEQLDKARANLYPEGHPQERVLTVFQYLVRYGTELLPALADAMAVGLGATAEGAA